MNKRTQAILDALDERYGIDVACHLHYKEPWQLLIATILSAQCTDARVNIVTKDLFVKYPGIEALQKQILQSWKTISVPLAFITARRRTSLPVARDSTQSIMMRSLPVSRT